MLPGLSEGASHQPADVSAGGPRWLANEAVLAIEGAVSADPSPLTKLPAGVAQAPVATEATGFWHIIGWSLVCVLSVVAVVALIAGGPIEGAGTQAPTLPKKP